MQAALAAIGRLLKPTRGRIDDATWRRAVLDAGWLPPGTDTQRLRALAQGFLRAKEFAGAHGLAVTDDMAVRIAAQACLLVQHLGLAWYDDFVTVVVHPGPMLATRRHGDGSGVLHEWAEPIAGEAMPGGPVTLSWAAVHSGPELVIHEFAHKLDMRGKREADGCPLLPLRVPPALRQAWRPVLLQELARLRAAWAARDAALAAHGWLGGVAGAAGGAVGTAAGGGAMPPVPPEPALHRYGCTSPAEFFAVACEAHLTRPAALAAQHPALAQMLRTLLLV